MIRELLAVVLGLGISASAVIFVMLVSRTTNHKVDFGAHRAILYSIAFLFVISRYLPSFEAFFNNSTVVQHAVGGGVISALWYWYVKKQLDIRFGVLLDLIFVFAVVSSLGALNEILENTVTRFGIYRVDSSDVWSDIVANTVGAFMGLLILWVIDHIKPKARLWS